MDFRTRRTAHTVKPHSYHLLNNKVSGGTFDMRVALNTHYNDLMLRKGTKRVDRAYRLYCNVIPQSKS